MQETQVWSLGREDPLEKEMATHSSNSGLDNPLDGGDWLATVHGGLKKSNRTEGLHLHFHFLRETWKSKYT